MVTVHCFQMLRSENITCEHDISICCFSKDRNFFPKHCCDVMCGGNVAILSICLSVHG